MNTVRTVSDAKRDFFQAFPKPITSVYRKVIDELLVELHLLTVNQTFRYNSIFALGVCTVFDRFMEGYQPPGDLPLIFDALLGAVKLTSSQLHHDAQRLREIAQTQSEALGKLLTSLETNTDLSPLTEQLREIAGNPQFKYSRPFAVGLFTLVESTLPQDQQAEVLKQCCGALYPQWKESTHPSDRFLRDLDLYRSNVEKMQQACQMMADMVEAERKKRANQANAAATTDESPANPSDQPA